MIVVGTSLTEQEKHVLTLLAHGTTTSRIGAELYVHRRVAEKLVRDACTRLGAKTRAEAVLTALRRGDIQ